MGRLLDEDAVIDVLRIGEELLNRILYEMDVVGQAREKYSWGLRLIESYIRDIRELPSAEPDADMIHLQKEQAYMQGWEDAKTSAQSEPHWIPTSKERPPQHQEIWITDDFGDVELVYGKDGIWLLDEGYYTEPEITAWMPANVPEPYRPEEESK